MAYVKPGYPESIAPTFIPVRVNADALVEADHQNLHQPKSQAGYVTCVKEVVKKALTVAASIGAYRVSGLRGAMAAGSLSSAVLSAADQQWTNKEIIWGSVIIEGAVGVLPGIIGESIVQASRRVFCSVTKKNLPIASQNTMKWIIGTGLLDGAVLGYVSSLATCAYSTYRKTGEIDWKHANIEGLQGSLSGGLGGALAGAMLKTNIPTSEIQQAFKFK